MNFWRDRDWEKEREIFACGFIHFASSSNHTASIISNEWEWCGKSLINLTQLITHRMERLFALSAFPLSEICVCELRCVYLVHCTHFDHASRNHPRGYKRTAEFFNISINCALCDLLCHFLLFCFPLVLSLFGTLTWLLTHRHGNIRKYIYLAEYQKVPLWIGGDWSSWSVTRPATMNFKQ